MYKPSHVFLPKALFSRACDHDIGLPSPKLPGSSPFPVQGEPLPVLPALPRVKSPSELPPWAPIPGIRQCTWSKCPPQAQGPPFLEIVLAWSSLPQGGTMHRVVLIFPFQIKHQSGTFLSQSYSSRLGRLIESRIQSLGIRRGGG